MKFLSPLILLLFIASCSEELDKISFEDVISVEIIDFEGTQLENKSSVSSKTKKIENVEEIKMLLGLFNSVATCKQYWATPPVPDAIIDVQTKKELFRIYYPSNSSVLVSTKEKVSTCMLSSNQLFKLDRYLTSKGIRRSKAAPML